MEVGEVLGWIVSFLDQIGALSFIGALLVIASAIAALRYLLR